MNTHMGEFGSDTLDQLTKNVRVLLETWADQFDRAPIWTLDVVLRGANRGKWKITISLGGAKNTMTLDQLVKEFYDRATIVGLARSSDPVLSAQQRADMAYDYGEGKFNGDKNYQENPTPYSSPVVSPSIGADEDVAALVIDNGSGTLNPRLWEFEEIITQDFRSFSRDVQYNGKQAKIEMTKI